MTLLALSSDCGVRIISNYPLEYDFDTKTFSLSEKTKQSIDKDIKECLEYNTSSRELLITQIIGTFKKKNQEPIWKYLVKKYGFQQTPWTEAKYNLLTQPKETREEIAIFYKQLKHPQRESND